MPLPLATSSNFGPISHRFCGGLPDTRFRDTATYNLKLSIKNCGQTAVDEDIVTINSL